MPRRKRPVQEGDGIFAVPVSVHPNAIPPHAEKPFDPSCTVRTTLGALQVGDMVDYWGTPVYMVTMHVSDNGRTYVQCKDGRKCQFALAPDDEIVWRQKRKGE